MKYKIFKWKFINLSVNIDDVKKIFLYFIFSSLSLVNGSLFFGGKLPLRWYHLLTILPILYVFNFLYNVSVECFFKNKVSKIVWVSKENRNNIWDSHALFFNIFIVVCFYTAYFKSLGVTGNNQVVLIIFTLYTLFFGLHRCLKNSELTNNNHNFFSILKYKSNEHVHVFAGTAIGLPFLIGISLGDGNATIYRWILAAISTYIIFVFGWITLYQYKYQADRFLGSYKFIIPSAFYPLFPVLYYIFFTQNLLAFILIFVACSLLYAYPLIHYYISDQFYMVFNEVTLMVLVLILSTFFAFHRDVIFEWVNRLESNVFVYSSMNFGAFMALIVLVITTVKNEEETTKYIRFYSILPYTILQLSHMGIWLICDKMQVLPLAISKNIASISAPIDIILIIFAVIYIVVSLFKTFPLYMEKIKDF